MMTNLKGIVDDSCHYTCTCNYYHMFMDTLEFKSHFPELPKIPTKPRKIKSPEGDQYTVNIVDRRLITESTLKGRKYWKGAFLAKYDDGSYEIWLGYYTKGEGKPLRWGQRELHLTVEQFSRLCVEVRRAQWPTK